MSADPADMDGAALGLSPRQALLAAHLTQFAINAKWGCQQEPKTRNHKDALRLIKLLREIGNQEAADNGDK